jgi:flagellar hook protein FlgE
VQGYGPAKGGALGAMGDIKVPTGQIAAVATTGIAFVGNMSADWTVPGRSPEPGRQSSTYNMVKQSTVYDSLGTAAHAVAVLRQEGCEQRLVYYSFDGAAPAAAPDNTLTFDNDGKLTGGASASFVLPAAPARPAAPSRSTTPAPPVRRRSHHHHQPQRRLPSGAFVGVELARTVRWSPSTATTDRRWSAPWPSPPSPTKAR